MKLGFLALGMGIFGILGTSSNTWAASGTCKLETTGQRVELKEVDPAGHFGTFLNGSLKGAQILARYNGNQVWLGVHGAYGSGRTEISLESFNRGEAMILSVFFNEPATRYGSSGGQWLTCEVRS